VTDPVPTDRESDGSCCCCCGDRHDFDRDAAKETPVTDPGSRDDDEHDDRHDGDNCRPDDEHGDKRYDRDRKDDPDSRGDGTPRDEHPRKPVNERPVTEPETAYAVRQRAPDAQKHTPGETMAPPPLANRLGKPAEPGTVPLQPAQAARMVPKPLAQTTSTVPGGQTVPGSRFVTTNPPSEGDPPPSKPAETKQFSRALAPTPTPAPVPSGQGTTTPEQDGAGNPPVPPPAAVSTQATPAYRTTGVVPVTGGPGAVTDPANNPYNFGGTYGQTTVPPPDGNVGPDPNVKFDEGQYNQLINVIADVEAGAFNSVVMGDVYLGTELKLQPSGQTWQPAVDLVGRGSTFGGSVDTQTTSLGDSLATFHDALEDAKAVFKNTDDLAAYDATKFTTEYPGFSGGVSGA
jgi:hypothetical protein